MLEPSEIEGSAKFEDAKVDHKKHMSIGSTP